MHCFQRAGWSLAAVLLVAGCAREAPQRPWAGRVAKEVNSLGYRNWIVLGDQAFPVHSRQGVRTIMVEDEIPEVLHGVLEILEQEQKVVPRIYVAQELDHVPNDRAPGIDEFRKNLDRALHGHQARALQYKSLTVLLEDSTKSFAVVVLKTQTALPYTSVFIELDSGYWDADSERLLREKMVEVVERSS
ncbi:MAG: hypothetical protein HKN82_14035 [Akkermansiaceae bacterium]|nr:hypothetical protein [Akkermansiaceae bacterium]